MTSAATRAHRSAARGTGKNRATDAVNAVDTALLPVHRGLAVLLFVLPITAVMAGAVSINGVTPHVFTSALFALVGVAAILRPHQRITRLALTVTLLVVVWFVITLLHIGLLHVPITNEVTIALSGLAILLGVATVRTTPRTFDAFVVGWTFAYLLAAVVAIMEKYFGFVPQNSYLVQRGYALEAVGLSSLFGNPNGFGLFILASSLVFMPFALAATKPGVRFLYCLLQFSTIYFMFESGSRTGLTCLFVVMVVTVWQLLRGRHAARAVLIIVVIALLIAQLLTPNGTSLLNGLRSSSVFGDDDDGSFLLRFNLVRNGLAFSMENPLIGIGPDMYEVYMQTRSDLYPTSFIINPHNGFIEILSQYGVIVFGLFVLLLIQSAVSGWRLMRTSGKNEDRNHVLGIAQLLLVLLLPFATTMHSTFLGAPAAWLYLCALIVLGRMAITKSTSSDLIAGGDGATPAAARPSSHARRRHA